MPKKSIVFPKYERELEQVGENLKLARKRRKLTSEQVAERAFISRKTLYEIESGNPKVSFVAIFNVLRVFGLHEGVLKFAADDELRQKLQDLDLLY